MPITQPMGHAHHIPTDACVQAERTKANNTRRIRSVKVATINWRMALTPLRMPSATNLADTVK